MNVAVGWTRLAWGCILALLLLQALWQLFSPSPGLPAAAGWLVGYLPVLPLLLALLFRLRHPLIYAGIAALIWFCHGVMEWYATPAVRLWAVAETLLASLYFVALYLRRRALRG